MAKNDSPGAKPSLLAGKQFGMVVHPNSPDAATTISTSRDAGGAAHVQEHYPLHRITANWGRTPLGHMDWSAHDGSIHSIVVGEKAQGHGVASAMYDRAREHAAENGLAVPRHSGTQTPDGERWAKSERARGIPEPVAGQQPLFPRAGRNKTKALPSSGDAGPHTDIPY